MATTIGFKSNGLSEKAKQALERAPNKSEYIRRALEHYESRSEYEIILNRLQELKELVNRLTTHKEYIAVSDVQAKEDDKDKARIEEELLVGLDLF